MSFLSFFNSFYKNMCVFLFTYFGIIVNSVVNVGKPRWEEWARWHRTCRRCYHLMLVLKEVHWRPEWNCARNSRIMWHRCVEECSGSWVEDVWASHWHSIRCCWNAPSSSRNSGCQLKMVIKMHWCCCRNRCWHRKLWNQM